MTNTPPLYALTPIDQTEGLESGWYTGINKEGDMALMDFSFGEWFEQNRFKPVSYLRPLPPGTVPVSEDELLELLDRARDMPEQAAAHEINQFIQTKLAQHDTKI